MYVASNAPDATPSLMHVAACAESSLRHEYQSLLEAFDVSDVSEVSGGTEVSELSALSESIVVVPSSPKVANDSTSFLPSSMSVSISSRSSARSADSISSKWVPIGLTYHLPSTLFTTMPCIEKSENAACASSMNVEISEVSSMPICDS